MLSQIPQQYVYSKATNSYCTENLIILPYLGKMSQIIKTRLTKTMNKRMKFCKLRVIFQTHDKLRNYFCFKDSVLKPCSQI